MESPAQATEPPAQARPGWPGALARGLAYGACLDGILSLGFLVLVSLMHGVLGSVALLVLAWWLGLICDRLAPRVQGVTLVVFLLSPAWLLWAAVEGRSTPDFRVDYLLLWIGLKDLALGALLLGPSLYRRAREGRFGVPPESPSEPGSGPPIQ